MTPRGYAFDPMVPPVADVTDPLVDDNPWVSVVKTEFELIGEVGTNLGAHTGRRIPAQRYTFHNDGSAGRARIHFQGAQRLRNDTEAYLALSGGDELQPASHVFVVRFDRLDTVGEWGTNIRSDGTVAVRDRIVRTIALSDDYWHGGGMSNSGDILAIPLEFSENRQSRVAFLHMGNPTRPKRIPVTIERSIGKAGAVALAKLPSGYFLCGVWREVSGVGRIDFYLTAGMGIFSGFPKRPSGTTLGVTWNYELVRKPTTRKPSYQNINFICEGDEAGRDDRTFKLYMIGTENTSGLAPRDPGQDLITLYRIDLAPETLRRHNPELVVPTITRIKGRQLTPDPDYCNLDAAGGVYITRDGELAAYAGHHWRSGTQLRMTEFW